MELNAVTKSVNELFSVSKKYHVPRFQREYSWEKEELTEFWNDITSQLKIVNKKIVNNEYFIGCIVLIGEDAKTDYLIVDGQQRLTTLTILLKAIINKLDALGDANAAQALYGNVIEGKDNDGKNFFRLLNETPKPYFQTEIQHFPIKKINQATTDEEKLLEDAYLYFNKQLNNFTLANIKPLEAVKNLRDQILNYVKFILVTAKSEEDAYTIFETLNARGIGLTSVDLIKTWIFKNYTQTHPDDTAKTTWADIKDEISGSADLETFFRHFWNSKYSFTSNARLYKSFNKVINAGGINDPKTFLSEIKEASKRYSKIGNPKTTDWKTQKEKIAAKYLDRLNLYKITQVRPFLLALLEIRERKLIDETVFIETIKNLENFHFIFSNLCSSRASGLENIYTQTARNLYGHKTDKAKIKKELGVLITTLRDKLPNNDVIRSSIENLKFTKNDDSDKKTIQTVFIKIEELLLKTHEFNVSSLSLEHIEDQSSGKPWVGRIGNLIPLDEKLNNDIPNGVNFEKKKSVYQKSNFKTVDLFIKKNPQVNWGEKQVDFWSSEIFNQLIKATKIKK